MDDHDDLAEAMVPALARHDPVPEAAYRAAIEALDWRAVDEELARMTADVDALSTARGDGPRLLSFVAGPVAVDLELSVAAGAVHLLGQVSPAPVAGLSVQGTTWTRAVEADADGRFSADGLPDEMMRLVVDGVTTEWFGA